MFGKIIVTVVIILMVVMASQVGRGQMDGLGVVGRMIAVERVVSDDCKIESDAGRCAFLPTKGAFDKLRVYLDHFRCSGASKMPRIGLVPTYEHFTEHDPGPVIQAEARDVRCSADPRTLLTLVDRALIPRICSTLEWKCDLIWIPDYDQTIAFIGRSSDLNRPDSP